MSKNLRPAKFISIDTIQPTERCNFKGKIIKMEKPVEIKRVTG